MIHKSVDFSLRAVEYLIFLIINQTISCSVPLSAVDIRECYDFESAYNFKSASLILVYSACNATKILNIS